MTTFSAEVRITPREGILDPEGQTIARALANLGYEGVSGVRAGRLIRLRLEAPDAEAARERVGRMCEELIANPVIEDYAIRIRAEDGGRATGAPEGDSSEVEGTSEAGGARDTTARAGAGPAGGAP